MKCKYCGKSMVAGQYCAHSPTKKCCGVPDSSNCVFCGRKFSAGGYCFHSTSKKHQLDS